MSDRACCGQGCGANCVFYEDLNKDLNKTPNELMGFPSTPVWNYSKVDVLEQLTRAHFSVAQMVDVGLRDYFETLRENNLGWYIEGDLMDASYHVRNILWERENE